MLYTTLNWQQDYIHPDSENAKKIGEDQLPVKVQANEHRLRQPHPYVFGLCDPLRVGLNVHSVGGCGKPPLSLSAMKDNTLLGTTINVLHKGYEET